MRISQKRLEKFKRHPGRCPQCYAPGVVWLKDEMAFDGTDLYACMECKVCEAKWIEKYVLSGVAIQNNGQMQRCRISKVQ